MQSAVLLGNSGVPQRKLVVIWAPGHLFIRSFSECYLGRLLLPPVASVGGCSSRGEGWGSGEGTCSQTVTDAGTRVSDGILLAGGPVYFCRVRDRRRDQHPECPESLCVLGLVQHPSFSPEYSPHGHQQHRAGTGEAGGCREGSPGNKTKGLSCPPAGSSLRTGHPAAPDPVAFHGRTPKKEIHFSSCQGTHILRSNAARLSRAQ